jgi:class 3 adenylate cyclase
MRAARAKEARMPTQNLAIMFTDIKGFTERTSGTTREGMKSLLAEHDRLLVPVFQYFDGRIVKTIGDAFLVTFASPTDAVLCGVTIQEVLRQYNLAAEEARRLEVRVAINVGEVEVTDNDVLGEAVNIAARLEGATEAGEVYFTDAVLQTMNRSEAPSADVGEKLFKGIPHPVRVYRVVHEPGSDLATRLANGVRLSDRGPVLAGIRATIRRRTLQRKALIGAAIAAAGVAAVGATAVFLRPAAVPAGPPPLVLEARAAVATASSDPDQREMYFPPAIKEYLARHPQDPQAPVEAVNALGTGGAPATRLWLQKEALGRGLAPPQEFLDDQLELQGDASDIDWQLLEGSRAMLVKYYPQQTADWAGQALAGSNVMAFLSAWLLLEEAGDPRLQQPHVQALKSLVQPADGTVVEATRGTFQALSDPVQRTQVLAFIAELVRTSPKFLGGGDVDSSRDALLRLRHDLEQAWGLALTDSNRPATEQDK